MTGRVVNLDRITRERKILKSLVDVGERLNTEVQVVQDKPTLSNTVGEDVLGLFRRPDERKAVIADMELIREFEKKGLTVPSFLEAGPRADLRHNPHTVRAAIVTTGGLAPGLHCVIHSIVKRHCHTYSIAHGKVFGVYNSFRGLCDLAQNHVELNPTKTEEWLDQGGSKLGIVRYFHKGKDGDEAIAEMADVITKNLRTNHIDILYVIGGDGSLKTAHKIAQLNPTRSIVGIPKTMDNDILWVWQSFGFNTAVEQATRVINTLRAEAESTRRICMIELFGAESGFVAANASLASGHVDLVLIPEVFTHLNADQAQKYLSEVVTRVGETVQKRPHNPHAVVVVAEGVSTVLVEKSVAIEGVKVEKGSFVDQLAGLIKRQVQDAQGQPVPVFVNQPRHHIRAVPANAHDQIYCERLGALAVDNALAGYTDFMISQWLTEFVLVPLHLVQTGQKSIPIHGMFWKQVVSSTGQPLSPAERPPGAGR
jgi:6-phosphofructokinase 1